MAARVAIYGVGGFGRELVDPLQQRLGSSEESRILCFADDNAYEVGTKVFNLDVVSGEDLTGDDAAVIAIGDGRVRRRIAERLTRRGIGFYNLFASSSSIGQEVKIGEGAVFCPMTIITASVRIGRQFQCNIYSYVAHDCVIGDYVTFAPRVNCNGNVHIGDFAYIGTGAILKQGTPDKPLRIGQGAIVGMGAVVTKDVPDGAVVMGNPAKPRGGE